MDEASVRLFEEYLEKYSGSVDSALAETIQAIALLGLSREDFFSHAAFYGGTALRLLHNIDREMKTGSPLCFGCGENGGGLSRQLTAKHQPAGRQ